MGMRKIVLKIRMLSVQLAGCRFNVVTTLRNRQRNDPRIGRGHLLDQLLRIIRGEQKIANRTYDASRVACDAPFDKGVKTILRQHDVPDARIMLEQSHSAISPLGVLTLGEQIIRIERLMSTMKTAHPHVHDGLADFLPIVVRCLDFRIELT